MKKYGKLNQFGEIIYAPEILKNNETIIINPNDEDYLNLGYKNIIIEETPTEFKGLNTELFYEENDNNIIIKTKLSDTSNDLIFQDDIKHNENIIINDL